MRTAGAVVVVLALFAGVGYLLLSFFSRLAGVDMLAACLWALRSKQIVLLLPLLLLYSISFFMLFAILVAPVNALTARATHKGGLAGYPDDDRQYVYYDPGEHAYLRIAHHDPPPAARRFDEAFAVVSFYRPLLADHYQNVAAASLPVSLLLVFFFLVGAFPLYLVLRKLAGDYASRGGSPHPIAHADMLHRLGEVTGSSGAIALAGFAVLVVAAVAASAFLSGSVARSHAERYGPISRDYRSLLASRLSAEPSIAGRVVRRSQGILKEYTRNEAEPGRMVDASSTTRAYPLCTVEFAGLLDIPVYLDLALQGDATSNPDVRRLDALFADDRASRPSVRSELRFRVDSSSSISLETEQTP